MCNKLYYLQYATKIEATATTIHKINPANKLALNRSYYDTTANRKKLQSRPCTIMTLIKVDCSQEII